MSTLRGYLTQEELEFYAGITITDTETADQEISFAEEIIDSYVGAQQKSMTARFRGFVTAASNTDTTPYYTDSANTRRLDNTSPYSISDNSQFSQLYFLHGYLQYCVIEMVSGLNRGLKRRILTNHYDSRTVFLASPFPNLCQVDDVYVIYQMQKFPRSFKDQEVLLNVFYKYIPENVKKAVAAQIEYKIAKGAEFQKGATDLDSESIEGYSYKNKTGHRNRMIAPKAREYLKGYRNVTGNLNI